jgi:hypothetical protein
MSALPTRGFREDREASWLWCGRAARELGCECKFGRQKMSSDVGANKLHSSLVAD